MVPDFFFEDIFELSSQTAEQLTCLSIFSQYIPGTWYIIPGAWHDIDSNDIIDK